MSFSYLWWWQVTEIQLTKLALLGDWGSDCSSGDRLSQAGLLLVGHKGIRYRTSYGLVPLSEL